MVWIVVSASIFLVFASLFAAAQPAHAAIPPLDPSDLYADAVYVVVGTVTAVSHQEVVTEDGTNHEFIVKVALIRLEKPPTASVDTLSTYLSGDTLEVRYWQIGKRPLGWTGPQGQNAKLSPNMQVRLFLFPDTRGYLRLLEPNGWEAL
ncbi:MAG: hypothetical protein KME30_27940 [Iphinoe sp. HA4291-MV1]|nr:hypothetical protein [Iphinoe sp. HA4291-MV1]